MTSLRTKRFLFVIFFLAGVALLTGGYIVFMLTRNVSFDWENPNIVEAT